VGELDFDTFIAMDDCIDEEEATKSAAALLRLSLSTQRKPLDAATCPPEGQQCTDNVGSVRMPWLLCQ
jgi:hypothetical protein